MTPSADSQEPAINQLVNDNDFVISTLTNPGIIDRLDQDIADYLSIFGFRLKWDVDHDKEQKNSGCRMRNGRCKAALLVPRLPYSYSKTTTTETESNIHNCCAMNGVVVATSTAIPSPTPVSGPLQTLHLHVYNGSLLATVGPLLRTFLRLSPHEVSPLRLRAVIHCKFTMDALEKINKMSSEQKLQQLNRQEELNAKRVAHHVHMLVRNSMGSALCMELVYILPCYWRRKTDKDEEVVVAISHGTSVSVDRMSVPISSNSVKLAMRDNPDACYPTVQLVEQHDETTMLGSYPSDGKYSSSVLNLHVRTRMCTVRHQPLLFQWIYSWQHPTTNPSLHPKPRRRDRVPLIITCIEKVGNLHRILMLCHDHGKEYCSTNGTGKNSFLSEVVVVMPVSAGEQYDKSRRNFNDAIDNFHKVIVGKERGRQQEDMKKHMRPTLVYEEGAAEMICEMIKERRLSTRTTQSLPQIVGIDLHADALILDGNYATKASTSPALQMLSDADAILFGYESTGIPQTIANLVLTNWVQIPVGLRSMWLLPCLLS